MMSNAVMHWSTSRETGSRRQLRLMRWLALHAPDALLEPLIWSISLAFACQSRLNTTQASAAYLDRALGRKSSLRDRHRHARMFAHVFIDRVKLLSSGLDGFKVDVCGQDMIEQRHASGRGGVLLGAHFGSFEALRAFERSLPGLRVRYLMYPDHALTSTALLNQLNSSVAERVISLQDGQLAMLEVFEALNRGEFVAFLGDRLLDPSVRSKIEVPFFGDAISVPTSPYIAAIAAHVPLFLCIAPRLGKDHYAIEFSMLYDGGAIERAERNDRITALAHSYAGELEAKCRRYPHNWFNFFDIWSE